MTKTKKILSLILALAMMLSCAALIFADESIDETSSIYYDAVESLVSLGIMKGFGNGVLGVYDNIQRYQMALFIGRIATGWTDDAKWSETDGTSEFTDLAGTAAENVAGAIAYVNQAGIINGYGNGIFGPTDGIRYQDALTMTVRALGYTDLEYPQGFINKASDLGVTVGISGVGYEDTLKREVVAQIIYNALFAETKDGGTLGMANFGVSSTKATIVVAPNGNDETGDGSAAAPYATLEAARDAVRAMDKTDLTGIDVFIKAGTYTLTETFKLTAEDSGTAECPIRYIGENGAALYGGVSFTAADFEALGNGAVVQYFPAEAKEHLVQIDLKKLGITASSADALTNERSGSKTYLYTDGVRMYEARFPNADDGWAIVQPGSELDPVWDDIDQFSGNTTADYYVIRFDEDYNERVHSWHNIQDINVKARFTFLWCSDDTDMVSLDASEPVMKATFQGGYTPREGMFFYWYHVPEELDVPGEYYIDDNFILYYYPMEGHENAVYTMPVLADNLITLEDVDYVTFDNLTIESSRAEGISGTGDYITIQNSNVRGVLGKGIVLKGDNITIQNNNVISTGESGISITSGDVPTLTRGNTLIYNNYIEDWSNVRGMMESAIAVSGCGITISHNEAAHSVDWGIGFSGASITCDYNELYDLGRFEGDGAAIHITQTFGGIMRYNYIHDIGFDDDVVDFVGVG